MSDNPTLIATNRWPPEKIARLRAALDDAGIPHFADASGLHVHQDDARQAGVIARLLEPIRLDEPSGGPEPAASSPQPAPPEGHEAPRVRQEPERATSSTARPTARKVSSTRRAATLAIITLATAVAVVLLALSLTLVT